MVYLLMLRRILVNKLLHKFTGFNMLSFIDSDVCKVNNFLIFSASFIVTVNNMADDYLLRLCANYYTSINVF